MIESSPAGVFAESFRFKARIATTDQAGSNYGAERTVMATRSPEWAHCHLPCNVHIIAAVFSKTFKLMDADISGMVHMSLSLSQGGSMQRFRRCLMSEIQEKLVIMHGYPTAEAAEHRKFLIELLYSKGPNQVVRAHLLETLPNGDWNRRDRVEMYVPAGVDIDPAEAASTMSKALVLALTGSLFRPYPRHRWLGADVSTNQVALCEAIRGLASTAFHRFLQGLQQSGEPQESPSFQPPSFRASVPGTGSSSEAMAVDTEGVGMQAGATAEPFNMGISHLAEPTAAAVTEDEEACWRRQAALNARYEQRRRAMLFLRRIPASHS